ncbi:LruC domain-containing protein [Arcticibacter sp. MXS-1]|uniref:LruC domain-containing protein n=1 Tax=Arcticibacter sp. MXS-1 TaxID=3341726 RepID=UPI0035A854F3
MSNLSTKPNGRRMRPLAYLSAFIAVSVLAVTGCKKDRPNEKETVDLGEKAAPEGFDYSTTKKVDINVRLLTVNEQPLTGVLVSVYSPDNISEGHELTKALTDKNGYLKTSVTVPSSYESLVIDPAFIGLVRNAKAAIRGTSVNGVIGGKDGRGGDIVGAVTVNIPPSATATASISAGGPVISYDPDNFDQDGRPIASRRSPVDNRDFAALMQDINNALPERGPVSDKKYLHTESPTSLAITGLTDIWITFLHEGASFKNVLGYYTYPTGKPPVSVSEIDTVHVIFLNASYKDSDGGMVQGDKVKIGRFSSGTSIGFVLLQNAFNSEKKSINTSATKFYSTEQLNPETDNTRKRHNVILHNVSQHIFMVGFEDINRMGEQSDNDFNDLMFYAQSNPVEAISPIGVPFLDSKVLDGDKDGVADLNDAYPEDPTRAYNRFYPSENVWGTTVFEDQWPQEGDYDLNDLVVSYRYKFAMNSENKVVDFAAQFKTLAAGASFQNGLGVQLPLNPSEVKSVTGYKRFANYIQLNASGLEAQQSKAVFIPFDNHKKLFASSSGYINTEEDKAKVDGQTVQVDVLFNSPISDSFTALAPFNPFMISNQERKREIHLVNHMPTDLAGTDLFGTGSDKSDPAKGKYYLTKENRPFALDFFGTFVYPIERAAIYNAYHHYAEWAQSGGTKYADWYFDKSGYRDNTKLYKK